jgi:hypothetical protein
VNIRWFLLILAACRADAQTEDRAQAPMSADRPGFATAPNVLARGVAQLEGGFSFSVDTEGTLRQRTLTVGSPVVRVGVAGPVELRVGGDGILSRSTGAMDYATGWSDVSLGAKVAVVSERRTLPAISLLPTISVPAGYSGFTSSTYDPGLAVAGLKTLPAGLSLVGTLTAARISDEDGRYARYSSAIALSFPAPARSAGYIEVYTVASNRAQSASARIYDAGVTHNFGPDLQIDVEVGRRLGSGFPCWFVAAGFALRRAPPFRN